MAKQTTDKNKYKCKQRNGTLRKSSRKHYNSDKAFWWADQLTEHGMKTCQTKKKKKKKESISK